MPYTVKAVADMAGVSIRALHHYDEIGLVKPETVSHAGYRQYTNADLERLQQVLFFRELGFGLQEIKEILDSPEFDRKEALVMHRKVLMEKQRRLRALIKSVDQTINMIDRGIEMENKDMFGGFDRATMEAYQEEARQRWGHTEAFKESTRRVAQYTKDDWTAIQAETEAINTGLAERMGTDPADPAVQELVGRWHQLINGSYYDCSLEVFRGLGEMYVADERFTAFYDKYKPGLAVFLRDAMRIYADRNAG